MPWEETQDFIRSGHGDPDALDPESMRTIDIDADKGIKAIVGCPKGKFEGGKCQNGTVVQSYLFGKDKGWTLDKAKAWFKQHKESLEGKPKTDRERLIAHFGEETALKLIDALGLEEAVKLLPDRGTKVQESFQWALPIIDSYKNGKGRFIKGVALSVGKSRNLTDYQKDELARAARTLIGKPLLVNHSGNRRIGYIDDAEFEDDKIEYIAKVTDDFYWRKIKNGEIKHVSPLGQPRFWLRSDEERQVHAQGKRSGTPIGIAFDELSLVVPPEQAGDLNTSVMVMETFLDSAFQQPSLEIATMRTPSVIDIASAEALISKLFANQNDPECPQNHYWNGIEYVPFPKNLPIIERALLGTRVIKQLFTLVANRRLDTSNEAIKESLSRESADLRRQIAELHGEIDALKVTETFGIPSTRLGHAIRAYESAKEARTKARIEERKKEEMIKETNKGGGQVGIVAPPSPPEPPETEPKLERKRLRDFVNQS